MNDLGLGLAFLVFALACSVLIGFLLSRLLLLARDLVVDGWERFREMVVQPDPHDEAEQRFLDEWWGDQSPTEEQIQKGENAPCRTSN